mmetsp:Transcript_73440/g.215384  ORF Transcript_73440/g.215384 Transcript_73440/m.215384 type:complete len:246 (-) Transcript_73440:70-807(-)
MLLSADSWYPAGPPPQEVVDKRWLWKTFSAFLLAVFVIRLIGGDIAGAVLSGLMVCFCMVLLRDGMVDMHRYVVAYGILCILNFVLDIVPLVSALGGRQSRTTVPIMTRNEDGVQQMTYRLTKITTPFFSASGVIYNMQSLAMLLSPLTMLMGFVLSLMAHVAFSRQASQEGGSLHSRQAQMQEALAAVRGMSGGEAAMRTMQGVMQGVGQGAPPGGGSGGSGRTRNEPSPRENFERFTGRPYKL